VHNLGLMLQTATTQGDGVIAWITSYGVQAILAGIALVLVLMVIACLRRTKGNSRGGDKKF